MTGTELTPSEELVMQALTARMRLGESWWTFDTRHRRTLAGLEAKGLIWVEAAPTPHLEAHLTEKGRDEWLSSRYVPQGARIEWGVQTDDDRAPVHYVPRASSSAREDEDYHRRYAARTGGALFRRWSVTSDWVQYPLAVRA